MHRITAFFIFILVFCCNAANSFGQKKDAYTAYIEQYKGLAIEQMILHHVPASITLAQGLLESNAGQSTLARKANNHFGIKCGGSWAGRYFIQDDDYKNERFRAYSSVQESYTDHSLFLKKPRYAALFSLKRTDYVGWAHGLKRAGYATNPRYAYQLINLIERYGLMVYDNAGTYWTSKHNKHPFLPENAHKVYFNNKNYFIIVRRGDTFKSIGKEMDVSYRKLIRYNELPKNYTLHEGDVIYLEKKRTKADRKYRNFIHTVKNGESLYTIAQNYGMRLKSLYKLNKLPDDYVLNVGDRLRIR